MKHLLKILTDAKFDARLLGEHVIASIKHTLKQDAYVTITQIEGKYRIDTKVVDEKGPSGQTCFCDFPEAVKKLTRFMEKCEE